VEVEGVVLMALVDYGDKAGGGGWDVAYASGLDDAGEGRFDGVAVISRMEPVEVDLDKISLRQLRVGRRGGPKERGLRLGLGRRSLEGLDDEQVGFGGEDQGGDAAIGCDKEGTLGEWLAGGEVGERSEGGEAVADAEEEVAVAKVPEVLGVVVQVPGGAGEYAAIGELEEDGVDYAVLIVLGLVGQARYEAVDDEGDEKVLVVDIVQREHGAAVEQELGRKRLEAKIFERDAQRWLRAAGVRGEGREK
jgi:hypothetical protein